MSGQTAVYRLYAADDSLLYIGVAKTFGTRWHQHAKAQPWWPQVHHQTIWWYETRTDAEDAELAAIKTEHPKYNKLGAVRVTVVPGSPEEVAVHETAELVRTAMAEHDEARAEHIAAVLAALRGGRPPMKVAELSPFTDTHLRQLAREAGIPPAVKGKRAET